MKALVTDVCILEPQVEAHAPAMFAVLSDPAIYEFEGEPPPSVEALAAGYRRKESRLSPDGSELLLNWVVRLHEAEFTGYVQAAVTREGCACIGYEFSSRYWRRGIATAALRAVLQELEGTYDVRLVVAVLNKANYRSMGLLLKLGFVAAPAETAARFQPAGDEMVLLAPCTPSAASLEEGR
jgi:RimJ/RimL family protein N-acetyltransferase